MDNKGIFSLDFLLTIMFILIISITIVSLGENNLKIASNMEFSVENRLLIDSVSNSINQVSSQGSGFSKIIKLPPNIQQKSYLITVYKNNITIESDNKKGTSSIFPIQLVDNNDLNIYEKKLYNGETYIIQNLENNKINIREY
ncbi:hypothetical protein LJC03_01755 [Methanobrevibacter sp. OttesenSCG-928-I08]|nr:hypothetical protein [Methanobrevibacter sp. OttesenSCG-928-I08]